MKILMVSPSFFPILGGCETVVEQLTMKLNESDLRTDVMTFNMDKKWFPKNKYEILTKDGFKVFRIPGISPLNSRFNLIQKALSINVIPKLNFINKISDYDIVHFHDEIDLSFPISYSLTHVKKKPRLLHCHGINYVYDRYRRNYIASSLLRKAADVYVALSNNSKELLLNLDIPEEKISIVPNSVNAQIFKPCNSKKLDNLVICVARITKSKGITTLLRALFYCENPCKLILIGPINDYVYFAEAQKLIKKINSQTAHNVTYLGRVTKEALIDYYQKATVFVLPSNMEVLPITILEALSCGTPVLASNVGGISDEVKDGINGILIPPNDPIALSSSLDRLLSDKKLRKLFGANGRMIVEESFSMNVVLGKLINLYRKLIRDI